MCLKNFIRPSLEMISSNPAKYAPPHTYMCTLAACGTYLHYTEVLVHGRYMGYLHYTDLSFLRCGVFECVGSVRMYICMYVRMYVCMHVCMYVCM